MSTETRRLLRVCSGLLLVLHLIDAAPLGAGAAGPPAGSGLESRIQTQSSTATQFIGFRSGFGESFNQLDLSDLGDLTDDGILDDLVDDDLDLLNDVVDGTVDDDGLDILDGDDDLADDEDDVADAGDLTDVQDDGNDLADDGDDAGDLADDGDLTDVQDDGDDLADDGNDLADDGDSADAVDDDGDDLADDGDLTDVQDDGNDLADDGDLTDVQDDGNDAVDDGDDDDLGVLELVIVDQNGDPRDDAEFLVEADDDVAGSAENVTLNVEEPGTVRAFAQANTTTPDDIDDNVLVYVLDADTYLVSEVVAPAGCDLVAPFEAEVEANETTTVTVVHQCDVGSDDGDNGSDDGAGDTVDDLTDGVQDGNDDMPTVNAFPNTGQGSDGGSNGTLPTMVAAMALAFMTAGWFQLRGHLASRKR